MPSDKELLVRLIWVVTGFAVALISLWAGFYFLFATPTQHWSKVPTVITTIVGVYVGIGVIVVGSKVDA